MLESRLWESAGGVRASDGQCQELGGFLWGQ